MEVFDKTTKLSLYMTVITINISRLNSDYKRQIWLKNSNNGLPKRDTLLKRYKNFRLKKLAKDIPGKYEPKGNWVDSLIDDIQI